jgi:hypothetical protein
MYERAPVHREQYQAYHCLLLSQAMSPLRVLLSVFLFFALLISAQDNRCDNGPCKIGCCNEFGWCGFGPKCKSLGIRGELFLGLTWQFVVPIPAN